MLNLNLSMFVTDSDNRPFERKQSKHSMRYIDFSCQEAGRDLFCYLFVVVKPVMTGRCYLCGSQITTVLVLTPLKWQTAQAAPTPSVATSPQPLETQQPDPVHLISTLRQHACPPLIR